MTIATLESYLADLDDSIKGAKYRLEVFRVVHSQLKVWGPGKPYSKVFANKLDAALKVAHPEHAIQVYWNKNQFGDKTCAISMQGRWSERIMLYLKVLETKPDPADDYKESHISPTEISLRKMEVGKSSAAAIFNSFAEVMRDARNLQEQARKNGLPSLNPKMFEVW